MLLVEEGDRVAVVGNTTKINTVEVVVAEAEETLMEIAAKITVPPEGVLTMTYRISSAVWMGNPTELTTTSTPTLKMDGLTHERGSLFSSNEHRVTPLHLLHGAG